MLFRSIIVDKLRSAVTEWLSVPEKEIDQEYRRRNDKVKLAVIALRGDSFRPDVTVGDQDVATYFDAHKDDFKVPEKRRVKYVLIDLDALRSQLVLAGYQSVSQVVAPGEFCVRGGLIDLFPMGSVLPYRIDLLDDAIDSIRTFDVDTQRTIYKVPEIRLLPAREFPTDDAGRNRFRTAFREEFEGDPSKSTIYRDVSNGVSPAGIEYWLPLFFEQTATLFDYLPAEATLCMHEDVHGAAERARPRRAQRAHRRRADRKSTRLNSSH